MRWTKLGQNFLTRRMDKNKAAPPAKKNDMNPVIYCDGQWADRM